MKIINEYYDKISNYLNEIISTEQNNILNVANLVAEQIKLDNLFYVYGPGGHSNFAAQEVFFRAGGLMHASAILDEGTHLKNGALRSKGFGRLVGYGRTVIRDYNLNENDLLIIVNAYGINTVSIDAALEAKKRGVTTVSVSSIDHAQQTPLEHPVRHPNKQNLHDLTDYHIDSKIKIGDAVISIDDQPQKMGPISTFTNSFIVNSICIEATRILGEEGISPPIWKSGNVVGGDDWNKQFIDRFKGRVKKL